jgi:hypothetical protein
MKRKWIAAKASWQAVGGKQNSTLILDDGMYHWSRFPDEHFVGIAEANLYLASKLLNPEVRTMAKLLPIYE